MSAPHAARIRRACGSSAIAISRCSRPTVSWRRSVASRKARWIVSSVSGANGTGLLLMALSDYRLLIAAAVRLHRHQQRKFVLLGQLPCRLQLGVGDVMGIDAGQSHAGSMDAHHDLEGFAVRLVEDRLEHPDDELLRGVVVVVQEHAPHAGPLDLLVALRLRQRGFMRVRARTHQLPQWRLPFY